VGEQFDGGGAVAVPYQKASGRGAESAYHPKNIFHCVAPSLRSGSDLSGIAMHLGGWMRQCSGALLVWAEAFAGVAGTATLWNMDSVRFGRVLGIGARLAAKTMVSAVDAATSPNPSAEAKAKQSPAAGSSAASASAASGSAASASTTTSDKSGAAGGRLVEQAARTTAQVRQTGRGLKEGGRRFGEAVWGPFVRLSGALWLELTGVFFGIFAVSAGGNAWKMRWALHETAANHDAHVRLLISVVMAAAFGYFCLSSFVKASRRVRRS